MALRAIPRNSNLYEQAPSVSARSSRSEPAHIAALTGLRFIAALWVVLYHFGQLSGLPQPIRNIVGCGFLGVNFFFLLSGFILLYTYVDTAGEMRGSRRAFWVARIARIYPLYLIGLLIAPFPSFPPHFPAASNPFVTRLADMTLTQAWLPFTATVWNPPGWSLAAEAFFYLIFPLLALPIARCARRLPAVTMGMLWIGSLLPSILYFTHGPGRVGSPWDADTWWSRVLTMNPVIRLPEFLLGIAVGMVFIQARDRGRRPPDYLAPMALLALLSLVALGRQTLGPLLPNGLLDPCFALVVYGLAWERSRIAKMLALPALVLLGEASYALYILHYPLWSRLTGTNTGVVLLERPRSLIFVTVYLIIAVGVALLSHRFIENPARRAIRRMLTRQESTGSVGNGVKRVESSRAIY